MLAILLRYLQKLQRFRRVTAPKFSVMGMPLFGLADGEFRAASFRAFNDWATDYCRYDLKRPIPLGLITLKDVPGAVAELDRIKKRGRSAR